MPVEGLKKASEREKKVRQASIGVCRTLSHFVAGLSQKKKPVRVCVRSKVQSPALILVVKAKIRR